MDGGAALAADHEAAKATQPREGALDGPPAPARFPAAVHALAPAPRRYRLCRSTPSEGSPAAMARGARLDPAPAAAGMVVSFVGAALVRASARSALLARTSDRVRGAWAVSRRAGGMPRRSVTRWGLVPVLPRSVGFGPVAPPPFWSGWTRGPRRLGSSRLDWRFAACAAAPGASGSTRPPRASRAAVAERSAGGKDGRAVPASRSCRLCRCTPMHSTKQQRLHSRPEVVRNKERYPTSTRSGRFCF